MKVQHSDENTKPKARAGTLHDHVTGSDPSAVVLVLSTVSDDGRADLLARTLVEERLAACVAIQAPMTSIYRWKGRVEREVERQVVIKTTRARVPAVEARLRELHPYELPEFIVLAADAAGEAYWAWVDAQTRPE
jgi:periplasmic divalent cation tolerance protein